MNCNSNSIICLEDLQLCYTVKEWKEKQHCKSVYIYYLNTENEEQEIISQIMPWIMQDISLPKQLTEEHCRRWVWSLHAQETVRGWEANGLMSQTLGRRKGDAGGGDLNKARHYFSRWISLSSETMKTCSATSEELTGGGRDAQQGVFWAVGKWDTWRPSNPWTNFQRILNPKLHLSSCSVISQSDNHLRPQLISGTFWRTVHAQQNCTYCDLSSALVGGTVSTWKSKDCKRHVCSATQKQSWLLWHCWIQGL